MQFQKIVEVQNGYTVQLSDFESLIECTGGTIIIPFGLPVGFYFTVVLTGTSPLVLDVVDAVLRSASGAVSLTTRWQSTTIYSRGGNDYIALGMP